MAADEKAPATGPAQPEQQPAESGSASGSTGAAHADPFAAWWLGALPAVFAAWAAPLAPVATNLERAYGGLADAFGLAPLREWGAAARDWSAAVLEQRRAQSVYAAIALAAAGQGLQTLTARLAAMGQRGESVDTLLALARLWANATDEALHAAMQSPGALQASADVIRASTRARRQQQRVVAIASEALNVPTRAEVDDAYREIQQLKRELRRLRKQLEAAASLSALPVPSASPAPPPPEDKKPPGSSPRANGAAAA